MRSNRICAREGPPRASSSFRNTVRISTDLSVVSVVLVSSRRMRGLVSMNLITKGDMLLRLVAINSILRRYDANVNIRGLYLQQAGKKTSQLIEVIRTR